MLHLQDVEALTVGRSEHMRVTIIFPMPYVRGSAS